MDSNLDPNLARHASNVSCQLLGELKDLQSFMEINCKGEALDFWKRAILAVEACINDELLALAYSASPELKAEVTGRMRQYGEFVLG
jgi:hypothetical protein